MRVPIRWLYPAFAVLVLVCVSAAAVVVVRASSLEVISSFSTDLSGRSPEQLHNIRRAVSFIDGTVLKPGQEFSFNKVVGQCGVAQGFEQASTIVDGEMQSAWGGGVCQVSSTLYNAALLANFKVTERHAHSRPVSSVPPGRDAATAFGIADLKFINSSGSLARLSAHVSGSRLTVSIMGKRDSGTAVEIITRAAGNASAANRRSGTIDASRQGVTVLTYRVILCHGQETGRELLSKDTYATACAGWSGRGDE